MLQSPYLARSTRKPITDIRTWYPELGFGGRSELVVVKRLVALDPISICDPFNRNTDPVADFVRRSGVFVVDVEGDGALPIWISHPHLIVPTHAPSERMPDGARAAPEDLAIDSASFVFLAPDSAMPAPVLSALAKAPGGIVELAVRPGRYAFSMAWRDHACDPNGDWDGVLVGEWSA
jgi:hypothetical protein